MTLKQKTYQFIILNDVSQIPEGCIPVCQLDATTPEKNALRMAMRDGRLQGYKIAKTMDELSTGAVWAHTDQAEAYLEYYRKPVEPKKRPAPPEPEPEKSGAVTEETLLLREIASRLETITKKLESLAL